MEPAATPGGASDVAEAAAGLESAGRHPGCCTVSGAADVVKIPASEFIHELSTGPLMAISASHPFL